MVKTMTFGPRRGAFVCGFIRSETGGRFFVHARDSEEALQRFDRVTFDPDAHSDPRGPRARRVKILERAPSPHVERFEDTLIVCSECRRNFVWVAAEQKFYRDRRLFPPKKCAPCRRIVRERLGLPLRETP